MTVIDEPLPEDIEFLEHFGTKGMKWGVRKERRLDRAKRVASGNAGRADVARFIMTDTSKASVKRNKGIQGAAASRVRELEGRKARIEMGRATVKDYLALHGGDRLWITGKA